MARKTIRVADVADKINAMIAATADDMTRERQALAGALESILLDTGNYHGFRYLPSEYLPADQQTAENVLRPDYDETRVCYYSA